MNSSRLKPVLCPILFTADKTDASGIILEKGQHKNSKPFLWDYLAKNCKFFVDGNVLLLP